MARPVHFSVVGAGTVGVCCALYLQRDGHRVTLIDRASPGSGCSYGNAGVIQIGACVPIATPGVLREVPKMLLDPEGPLVIRWQYLPQLAPYLLRFIARRGRRASRRSPRRWRRCSATPSTPIGPLIAPPARRT
ncbi:MAG: FAD-dependent oxidoreductase [Pseudomonadota bacterium]